MSELVPTPEDILMAETRLHTQLFRNRPDWDSYLLGLAFIASRRSPDQHTKHGTCLVDPRNRRILALGYNGFPGGMDERELPLSRPSKYAWLTHSESNAISNMTKDPWDIPSGPVAYITGTPCFDCAKEMVRNNIKTWVCAERRGFTNGLEPIVQANWDKLVAECGVQVRTVRPDLNFLADNDFLGELERHSFLTRQPAECVGRPEPRGPIRRFAVKKLEWLLDVLQAE